MRCYLAPYEEERGLGCGLACHINLGGVSQWVKVKGTSRRVQVLLTGLPHDWQAFLARRRTYLPAVKKTNARILELQQKRRFPQETGVCEVV